MVRRYVNNPINKKLGRVGKPYKKRSTRANKRAQCAVVNNAAVVNDAAGNTVNHMHILRELVGSDNYDSDTEADIAGAMQDEMMVECDSQSAANKFARWSHERLIAMYDMKNLQDSGVKLPEDGVNSIARVPDSEHIKYEGLAERVRVREAQ